MFTFYPLSQKGFMFRLLLKSMFVFGLLVLPGLLSAVETAPRISDREIIEGLAGLNIKYAQLQGQINEVKTEMKAEFKIVHERFESIDKRFESMDQRFESMDQRFESIDKRFESIDQRFVSLENLILTLYGSLILLITTLFGYIAWDRKTSMRPIEKEVQVLKQDLEIQRKTAEGVSLADVLGALRVAAQNSQPLADALKKASLL